MRRVKEDAEETDEAPRAVLMDRSTCVPGSGSEQLFLRSKRDSSGVLSSGLSHDTADSFGADKKTCAFTRRDQTVGARSALREISSASASERARRRQYGGTSRRQDTKENQTL